MNRFQGLDLVNSVPEELWIEVCNIVQEEANKTIPKKKKSKKEKWLSEEALQIAGERREVKSKEERESEVTHLYLTLATPWTVAYQASRSMGFSRQEYWSGVPCIHISPPF